jgi:hypothetical protein
MAPEAAAVPLAVPGGAVASTSEELHAMLPAPVADAELSESDTVSDAGCIGEDLERLSLMAAESVGASGTRRITCAYSCSSSERTSTAPAVAVASAASLAAAEGLLRAVSCESDAECVTRSLAFSASAGADAPASPASAATFSVSFCSPAALCCASLASFANCLLLRQLGNLRESLFERHLVVDGALSGVHVIIAVCSILALLVIER